jgi:hypothetical protein
METNKSQIAECLQRFRKGDRDGAFFGLLETDHGILPELMAAFRSERDSHVREFLVEIIGQHRQSSVIPFLKEALNDPAAAVSKQAIDGLVVLASPAALEVFVTEGRGSFGRSGRQKSFVAGLMRPSVKQSPRFIDCERN